MTDEGGLGRRRGWVVVLDPAVEDALLGMAKYDAAGEALCRATLRFLRALALETGAAHDAAKQPPGVPLSDGRLSLAVPREPVLLYYVTLPDHRELRVTDLIWIA